MNQRDALLAQLQALQMPAPGPWQQLGAWLLPVLGCLLLLLLIVLWRRRRSRRNRWRREARDTLQQLRADVSVEPAAAILARCSALARRLLLVAEPRSDVASLHGDAWLARLDAAAKRPLFSQGFGRLLLDQPYQRSPQVPPHDLLALIDCLGVLTDAVRPTARR